MRFSKEPCYLFTVTTTKILVLYLQTEEEWVTTQLKKLYGPFLWMGFNCIKATESLRGSNLLFTTKIPEIPSTHLIDFGRMRGWVDLGTTQWFRTRDRESSALTTQPLLHKHLTFTCSKSAIETIEKGVNMFKVNTKNNRTTLNVIQVTYVAYFRIWKPWITNSMFWIRGLYRKFNLTEA